MSPLNWAILLLILLSIAFGLFVTEPTVADALGGHAIIIDRVILGVFALEYVARLATAGLNPNFRGFRGLLRYASRPASIADLLVILPIFLVAPPTWIMIFRLLRILRLIRLATLPHIHQAISEFTGALAAKRFELTLTLCLGLVLILFSSTALFLLEGHVQPEIFGSVPRALWWSVVTFTTVGYGDAVPITLWGRFFTGLFAISGVGLVAMLTGVIASALGDAAERHTRHKRKGEESGGR